MLLAGRVEQDVEELGALECRAWCEAEARSLQQSRGGLSAGCQAPTVGVAYLSGRWPVSPGSSSRGAGLPALPRPRSRGAAPAALYGGLIPLFPIGFDRIYESFTALLLRRRYVLWRCSQTKIDWVGGRGGRWEPIMRANVKNVRACRLKAEEVATWVGGALAMLSMLFLCTED